MSALEVLADVRLVPVVNIDDISQAVPLAETLLAAGIGAIEVTLRTECGLAAIEAIRKAVPGMVVGAGSVRQAAHVTEEWAAGAQVRALRVAARQSSLCTLAPRRPGIYAAGRGSL